MRDVGRVLEMPYGQVDKLTKLVPNNPRTRSRSTRPSRGAEAAGRRTGRAGGRAHARHREEAGRAHRHASTHAAGVVIGDRPLEQLVPLYRDPKTGMRVTQYNMKWVEQAGLVKFDFLGLKTLTVLKKAVELIGARGSRSTSRPSR
jgi:DNA polymerase-3 subunit alpha